MMNIVRAPRHGQFELIPVAFLRDKSLSFRARGLGSRILTNVDGYACTALTLAAESKGEGKHAIQTALGELRQRRYLIVYHRQGYGGRWETWSVMHDVPQPASVLCDCNRCLKEKEKKSRAPEPDNQVSVTVTETRSPGSGEPDSGPPTAGNRVSKSSNTNTSTNINTTTTTPTELVWPLWFNEEQQAVVVERMGGLDQMLQQKLLDQFQGKMEKAPPRSPMDWFIGTIKNAWDGKFVLTYGDEVAVRRARRAQEAANEAASMVAAAETEKRENELQARLNGLEDSQVLELLAGDPSLEMSQIEIWLQSGRPVRHMIASLARQAISRKK